MSSIPRILAATIAAFTAAVVAWPIKLQVADDPIPRSAIYPWPLCANMSHWTCFASGQVQPYPPLNPLSLPNAMRASTGHAETAGHLRAALSRQDDLHLFGLPLPISPYYPLRAPAMPTGVAAASICQWHPPDRSSQDDPKGHRDEESSPLRRERRDLYAFDFAYTFNFATPNGLNYPKPQWTTLSSRAGVSKAALPTYGSAAFLNTLATNPIHHSRSLVTEPHDGSDEWMNRISCPTLPSFSREHWTSGQAAVTGRRLPLLSSFSLFALSPTRCLLLVDRVFATGSMVFL